MTWVKDGSIYVMSEPIDAPSVPRTLKTGWTISEVPGIGIFNPRVLLTPIQRIYIDLLKYGRHVFQCEREGNTVRIKTNLYSNHPETYMSDYKLEPKDAIK